MSEKWANVDAGPRQVKDLQRAMGKLRGEGQAQDELTGVIGGKEDTWTTIAMMSPVRAEVVALDDAIRAKYDHKVTRANVRDIIAEYVAALPEARKSRPVVDNRRTQEQEAERVAANAERDAKVRAEEAERNAVRDAVLAKKPARATRIIIAEQCEDNSDPMTDYFSSRTTRTVAIGWGYSSREDFRALHAAAAQFPETAGISFSEHRDNYSMGAGNYLSDHGWSGAGTGWLIKSRTLPANYLHVTEDAIPDTPAASGPGFWDQRGNWIPQAAPAALEPGTVTVSASSLGREGVVEVRFSERPADDVLAGLKAHGFRWAKMSRCWYGSDSDYAETLATA